MIPSLGKYRKQKQSSPPGNTQNGARPGGRTIVKFEPLIISKISIDLCTIKPSQHKTVAHYRRFEVCQFLDHVLNSWFSLWHYGGNLKCIDAYAVLE
jgi:hypothetical protein